ncbi:hypothetical protein JCM12141A_47030 [Mycolicibacterium hodleri]
MATNRRCDGCGDIYAAHRPSSRFCTTNCRVNYHRRLARGAELLAADRAGRPAPLPTPPTTNVSRGFEALADEAARTDYYFGTFKADPNLHVCQRCGNAFQAETKQRHCSIACRDADRDDAKGQR